MNTSGVLEYVVNKLRYTSLPVTEIWLGAGFESQRTFNRVFKEKYHMSPREYRRGYAGTDQTDDAEKTLLRKDCRGVF